MIQVDLGTTLCFISMLRKVVFVAEEAYFLCLQIDLHFMKKIPPGAEASNILVGELEFLEKPVVAFIRLSPAVLLNGLAEVPITTR